jgi:hypothetical protein
MESFLHFTHGHRGQVFDSMSNSVGVCVFFLSKDYAGFISSGFGKKMTLCGRDGAFNLVVIKLKDKDGMRFDRACGDY